MASEMVTVKEFSEFTFTLQWGRGWLASEICLARNIAENVHRLQSGQGRLALETIPLMPGSTTWKLLQWDRGEMASEISGC